MPGQPEEDRLLLKYAQQGQVDAFGVLYERHAASIFRYLYAHLGSRLDAEDLTSDVFLRAWQALPTYDERGVPFRAFLFRIAHNALVDHYRHQKRNPSVPLEEADLPTDGQPNPVKALLSRASQQELAGLLDELKDNYRTVLALRFISQLSPSETAVAMRRTPGAIRVMQHRALEALRHKLKNKEAEQI